MRKFISAFFALVMTISIQSVAQAQVVSMFDYGFEFHASGAPFSLDEFFSEFDIDTDEELGDGYAAGAFSWDHDINIPEGTHDYWLELSLEGYLEYYFDGSSDEFEFDHEDLGLESMYEFHNIELDQSEIEGLLAHIASSAEGFIDDAGFEYESFGDFESGLFVFADFGGEGGNILDLDSEEYIWLDGELSLTLTAHTEDSSVVPEPATMLLFGSGLMGAFVRRRRS